MFFIPVQRGDQTIQVAGTSEKLTSDGIRLNMRPSSRVNHAILIITRSACTSIM